MSVHGGQILGMRKIKGFGVGIRDWRGRKGNLGARFGSTGSTGARLGGCIGQGIDAGFGMGFGVGQAKAAHGAGAGGGMKAGLRLVFAGGVGGLAHTLRLLAVCTSTCNAAYAQEITATEDSIPILPSPLDKVEYSVGCTPRDPKNAILFSGADLASQLPDNLPINQYWSFIAYEFIRFGGRQFMRGALVDQKGREVEYQVFVLSQDWKCKLRETVEEY